jgi:hypothetical protein
MKIAVIGRAGSVYRKQIKNWLGSTPVSQAQGAFNYGLQGQKLREFMGARNNRRLRNLPILNHEQLGNKYECIKGAQDAGVMTPASWQYRDRAAIDVDKLIIKPYYSLGGRNISRIGNLEAITPEEQRTHYIQEEITNRRYELRCVAMSWIDPKDWLFQKRVHENGDEELAWNHHNGGKFITVEDPSEPLFDRVRKDVKTLMKAFNYQFGAVDFIVQNPGRRGEPLRHYFIEWNLAPGWTLERTAEWYEKNFKKLCDFTQEEYQALSDGMLLSEIRGEQNHRARNYLGVGNGNGDYRFIAVDELPDDPDDLGIEMDEEEDEPEERLWEPVRPAPAPRPQNPDYGPIFGSELIDIIPAPRLEEYSLYLCGCGQIWLIKIGLELTCPICGADLEYVREGMEQ